MTVPDNLIGLRYPIGSSYTTALDHTDDRTWNPEEARIGNLIHLRNRKTEPTKTQPTMNTEQAREEPTTHEEKREEQEQTEETKIDPDLQNKITRFKALREQGIYFNDNLVQSKSYRNPNIYTKLVEFLSLHESSTNFEPTFWDPRGFPDSAQADSLRTYLYLFFILSLGPLSISSLINWLCWM
ncbi:hypothetical protein PGT21_015695 [Puccinia graminis f. sp. tritici]|uniref:Uncharacterized protein n=1 Tax=Puccinia graminis f. sp. tritici TaxID=56615 RepID=A0A5B0LXU3_PUCGR|nr:hypothetical protein PGTUg99_036208 [Puccinia graminis f. sp. tritici]KAA1104235.1 hypothetical protein PGT21_015695 [Puccinia graminis f. sp. tritici]